MKYNNIWEEKRLDYSATKRVKAYHSKLIDQSLKDRSSEWFVQEELDEKYGNKVMNLKDDNTTEKVTNERVIVRRAKAINAMLEALTDEELSKGKFTSIIHEGDLLLGNLPMASNGLGKVIPTYLTEEEKRAGSITNRGSLSLFGHNSINYADLVNKGLNDIIKKCNEKIKKHEEKLSSLRSEINEIKKLIKTPKDIVKNSLDKKEQYKKEKESILKRTLKKLLRFEDQKDFYKAVKISCEAVIEYAGRFADIAEKEAEKEIYSSDRKKELIEMARIARKVPREKADTFHEALQSIWFFHLALHSGANFISLGRLDQTLNPFLEKEENYDKCLEIFECFMIKAAWRLNLNLTPSNIVKQDHIDNNNVLGVNPYLIDQKAGINNFLQNIIIGGVKPNGEDATNDCTFLILKAFSNVNLSTPGLYIRVGKETPEDLKRAIVSTWDSTKNNPSIINDETMIPAMKNILQKGTEATMDYFKRMLKDINSYEELSYAEQLQLVKIYKEFSYELSYENRDEILEELNKIKIEEVYDKVKAYFNKKAEEEANDYCVDGCWEPILNGKSDWTFAMLCALNPMECALNQGAMLSDDPELLRGQKIAPHSRKPKNFEELLEVFSEQLNFFVDQSVTSLFMYYMLDEYSTPSPLLSAYIGGCMEYGRDKSWGGAEYNIGGVILSAIPDVVNTFMAFKKWVIFEDDEAQIKNNKSDKQKYNYDLVLDALKKDFKYDDPNNPIQSLFDQIKLDFDKNTPTFGNNDDEVDEICEKVLGYYTRAIKRSAKFAKKAFQIKPSIEEEEEVRALRSIAGYYGEALEEKFGAFNMMISAGLGTFEQYNWSGKGNAASAGRLRGEPLTPNFGPAPGTVINGVAGITESLSKVDLGRFPGGVITDICIEAPTINPEKELMVILDDFIRNQGGMMTLTIGEKDLYKQIYEEVHYAQNKPLEETQKLLKKYAHINVRIGGWQTPFVTLPFSHMENYIKRPVAG